MLRQLGHGVLINAILKRGGKREYFEIKMFGGGRVLTGMTNIDIGARNIEFAREYLRQEKFALAAEDVGDICPRKIIYFPKTGAVKLRRLVLRPMTQLNGVRDYLLSMNKNPLLQMWVVLICKTIKVLIIDDSALIRALLREMINSDRRFSVVAESERSYEARELIKARPDVPYLDVEMPRMNGITF